MIDKFLDFIEEHSTITGIIISIVASFITSLLIILSEI